MSIVVSTNTGLRKKLRRLFTFSWPVQIVSEQDRDCEPRGIIRTAFEDNIYNYFHPVFPADVKTTEQCVAQFGRKLPTNFKTITLAAENTFRSN